MESLSGLCPQGPSILDGWTMYPLPSHGDWDCAGLCLLSFEEVYGGWVQLSHSCPLRKSMGAGCNWGLESCSLAFTQLDIYDGQVPTQHREAEADK